MNSTRSLVVHGSRRASIRVNLCEASFRPVHTLALKGVSTCFGCMHVHFVMVVTLPVLYVHYREAYCYAPLTFHVTHLILLVWVIWFFSFYPNLSLFDSSELGARAYLVQGLRFLAPLL